MILWLVLTVALGAPLALAQAPQTSRDAGTTPAAAQAGTAVVSGVVTSADASPQPLRRVIVTIAGADLPTGRSAITDDNGRFSIENLPAGRFTLVAKKAAYLPALYGALRPGRPGIELALGPGQRLTGLAMRLTRGAAISGTIRDSQGQPLANAAVSAMRRLPGGAFAPAAATGASDDRGRYRIFGLVPGEYFVSATQASLISTTAGAPTVAEMDATLAALRRGRAAGRGPAASVAGLAPIRPVNLSPVFFPGVLSPALAEPVKVAAGDNRTGADITLQFGRTATISGVVAMPAGASPQVALTINQKGPSLPIAMTGLMSQVRAAADGTFSFRSVNPGSYIVQARTVAPPPARGGGPGEASPSLWGRNDVDVNGEDVSGLAIILLPTLHVTGRLVFDGTSPRPADLTTLRVAVTSAADEGMRRMTELGLLASAALPVARPAAADGSFDVDGIVPGTFTITVTPVPAGWWLRSAAIEGKDALDTPFEVPVGATAVPPVVLTFTDRRSTLSGTIHPPAQQQASSYFIVVFPTDRSLRRAGSRRVVATRAGSDARFIVRDLPAGDYLLAAVTDFEPDDLLDPAFFDALAPGAAKITMGEGEQKTQDLRIGG